jgi:hypothetical protein
MTRPVSAIELSVRDPAQLFDSLDPYPFRERDLDPDAEAFIIGWARELPRDHALRIVIHVSGSWTDPQIAQDTGGGIGRFFAHRAEAMTGELRELFRVGRISLLIGLSVLVLCVAAAQYVQTLLPGAHLASIVSESLIILGWVANWRPLEIFLYDWWPLVRRRNLYRRLTEAPVDFRPTRVQPQG